MEGISLDSYGGSQEGSSVYPGCVGDGKGPNPNGLGDENGLADGDDIELLDGDVSTFFVDGMPATQFSERVYQILERSTAWTMVIKLLGRRIGFNALSNRAYALWKLSQAFESWTLRIIISLSFNEKKIMRRLSQRGHGLCMINILHYNRDPWILIPRSCTLIKLWIGSDYQGSLDICIEKAY
ncbi:hypothetical protein GOBAR_AA22580 [Gossypium barbadense]|uniref:DUF4283 domain-containing protein n=1 Tax=Gossypium barbadense TaxID=3634 RepID=A0A2P5X416_GOSBA|nr:hypothetical protein GOBAR_AA22580 [Gossypium barbadense]